MRNDIIIFRGPSISLSECKKHLDNALYLPPAMQGDMYKAHIEHKPLAMGLIDGNFERIPSPWHKEILYLMSQGVKIFGSSSMGALRAAELDHFGMIGIGEIYKDYTNNIIEDDDEVAILHSPQEFDYKPLSDAMVDIRQTLKKAENTKIISTQLRQELEKFYKNLFYKNRIYQAGIDNFRHTHLKEIISFSNWLPFNKVEQKKEDAICLLNKIQDHHKYSNQEIDFQNTVYWHNLKVTLDENFNNTRKDKAS